MRKIIETFIQDLNASKLKHILDVVKEDDNIVYGNKKNAVKIYYRGGMLYSITDLKSKNNSDTGYMLKVNTKYCIDSYVGNRCWNGIENAFKGEKRKGYVKGIIKCSEDSITFVNILPFIKSAMDNYISKHPQPEKEIQQYISRENNDFSISSETDYFITDTEYVINSKEYVGVDGRFDMIAIKWPTTRITEEGIQKDKRSISNGVGISVIEVKFGDGAIKSNQNDSKADGSGVKNHFNKICKFLKQDGAFKLSKEIESVLKQKYELGLLKQMPDSAKNIKVNDSDFEFMYVFGNHRRGHKRVNDLLLELKEIRSSNDYIELFGNDKKARLKIASSRPMGYGLYIDAMMDLDEYIEVCEKRDIIK